MGFFKKFTEKPKPAVGWLIPSKSQSKPKPKVKPMIGGPAGVRKMPSMRTGGMVVQTKPHLLHKGEMVIPAHLVKHFTGLMKK
jgi:hypothetical protein